MVMNSCLPEMSVATYSEKHGESFVYVVYFHTCPPLFFSINIHRRAVPLFQTLTVKEFHHIIPSGLPKITKPSKPEQRDHLEDQDVDKIISIIPFRANTQEAVPQELIPQTLNKLQSIPEVVYGLSTIGTAANNTGVIRRANLC